MNKVAIITGADGGMGREILEQIAKAGYTVIMGRKGEEVKGRKGERAKGEIIVLPLDLSDFNSIITFTESIKSQYSSIDLLINNAGVLNPKNKIMEGDVDATVGVNYLGHFMLTQQLLPLLIEGSRIVNMGSLTYRFGKITPHFFEPELGNIINQVKKYSDSKLALLYFTIDLAAQLLERRITVNCADPGIVGTKIIAMNNATFDKICDVFARPFMRNAKKGAETAIYLALDNEVANTTGKYFKNKKITPLLKHFQQKPNIELLRELTHDIIMQKNLQL